MRVYIEGRLAEGYRMPPPAVALPRLLSKDSVGGPKESIEVCFELPLPTADFFNAFQSDFGSFCVKRRLALLATSSSPSGIVGGTGRDGMYKSFGWIFELLIVCDRLLCCNLDASPLTFLVGTGSGCPKGMGSEMTGGRTGIGGGAEVFERWNPKFMTDMARVR